MSTSPQLLHSAPCVIDRAVHTILMLLIRQGVEGCSEDDQIVSLNELIQRTEPRILSDSGGGHQLKSDDHKIRAIEERSGVRQRTTTWQGQSEEGFTLSWREKVIAAPYGRDGGRGFTKNPNLHVIMDSMRDVGDEVWFGREGRGHSERAHGDLFAHSTRRPMDHTGPHDLGLNKWDVEPHQMRRLQIEEQVLSTLVLSMTS